MAISNADWQAIWNEGYQVGWNDRYKQNHAVTHAPSNVALCISKANWDAVYNAGFDDAYGKKVSAPAPGDIPHDDAVCPPAATPATTTPPPVATVSNAGPQFGLDAEQWGNAYLMWRIGHDLGAPYLAIQAALCAGFGENSFHTYGCNSGGYCGVWQVGASWQKQHVYTDVAYWTTWAYQHGFYGYGGIIDIARAHPDYSAGYIANLCQGAYANLTEGGNYYGKFEQQANQIYNYWQGASPGVPGATQPAQTPAPSIQSPTSAIAALNWAGGYEVAWQTAEGGAKTAVASMKAYNDRLVTYDYVEPATFSRKA